VGEGNLGDEVMLEAARRLLPEVDLIVPQSAWRERALARLGLSGPSYFHSFILGGGTLIAPYWLPSVRAAQEAGIPIWSLANGVGSSGFGDAVQVDLADWKAPLSRFQAVSVRGPRSLAQLRALGIERAEVIGDLALSLTSAQSPPPLPAIPRFLVNVTLPPGQTLEESSYASLTDLERLIRELIGQGWMPVPVAMHHRDIEPLQTLMNRACHCPDRVLVPKTAEEFFALVAPCHVAIAVRLHAAILACCLGVPPLMLGYRDKCLDFMESMELQNWHIPLDRVQPGELRTMAHALIGCAAGLRPEILASARAWKAKIVRYVGQQA
jgi:polysaccharide pyruvyl transferase WcaK-like protein